MQQPLIIVDAGNLLFKKALSDSKGISNTTALITAYGLVRAYKQMSYDAVGISSNDLSAGTEFFRRSIDNSFPWVAANIYDKKANLLFSPHIIKKSGNLTIGIIGLTGAAGNNIEDFVISDWRKSLRKQIALLQKNCDMLVVLSSLNLSENKEIQRDFKQIDIIVSASQKGRNIQPQTIQNCLLIQGGGRGKYIGKLDITRNSEGSWHLASPQSPDYQKNRLRSIDRQLKQLAKQQSLTGKDFSQKMARLRSSREIISKQIAQQVTDLTEKMTLSAKSYKSSFLPVKPKSPTGKIGIIVQDIKKSINTFTRYQRAALQPGDPAVRRALQNDEIAGISSCVPCHEKQAEFWKNTRHSNAYATLSQQGQSFNLQCLPCHVTAGKVIHSSVDSELLFLLTLSTDRQTIGCEVCHGPGNRHLLSPDEVTPERLPSEKICLQCHTPDRDNNFDYQKKLATIACPVD